MRILFQNARFVIAIVILALVSGCDDCENCDNTARDPKVRLKFVATGTREMTRDTLESISNSLGEIREQLETETDPDKIDSLSAEEIELLEDSVYYSEWEVLFNSGRTHINLMEGVGAVNSYMDTVVRDFALPVNMHADSSVFYFVYHDLIDTMKLNYKRDIVQTLDGVRMKIIELEVDKDITTFDSVSVRCGDENCSNWEMNIEAYF